MSVCSCSSSEHNAVSDTVLTGFYSLFSVTEEPFVTSGGKQPVYFTDSADSWSVQDNGWAFTGRIRKTRYVVK